MLGGNSCVDDVACSATTCRVDLALNALVGGSLRNGLTIGALGSGKARGSDIGSAAATCAERAITVVSGGSLSDDLAVSVDGIIGGDVTSACFVN